MPNHKELVQQSTGLIEKSELKDLLLPLWRLIEWQSHAESINAGAELDRKGDAVIHLYQSVNKPEQLLREFGAFVLLRSGNRGEALWQNKLDVPTLEQVATVKQKLEDPELRKTCKTYKDVLDTYPDKGGSVDRLVFINVMNALLANNVSFPDSVGVDILSWGPTTHYAKQQKYHCLIPLVSAYSPADVYKDYGHALTAMIVNKLGDVRDSSVAFALRGIVQRIARIASPA